jgi:hypothetical protein
VGAWTEPFTSTAIAIEIEILQNHFTWWAFQFLIVRTFLSDLFVRLL